MKNKVYYLGKWYIQSIVIILSVFSFTNIISLFFGYLISVIPIIVQITLLFLIWRKDELVPFCIKLWASVLIFAGTMGLLSKCISFVDHQLFHSNVENSGHSALKDTINVVLLFIGFFYFYLCADYVRPIKEKIDNDRNEKSGAIA